MGMTKASTTVTLRETMRCFWTKHLRVEKTKSPIMRTTLTPTTLKTMMVSPEARIDFRLPEESTSPSA